VLGPAVCTRRDLERNARGHSPKRQSLTATIDSWLGVVVNPTHADYASLRGTVRDVDGNEGEQTIIRAYRVANR
jgi:hypothetical protein